jgi:hypothetical protein
MAKKYTKMAKKYTKIFNPDAFVNIPINWNLWPATIPSGNPGLRRCVVKTGDILRKEESLQFNAITDKKSVVTFLPGKKSLLCKKDEVVSQPRKMLLQKL